MYQSICVHGGQFKMNPTMHPEPSACARLRACAPLSSLIDGRYEPLNLEQFIAHNGAEPASRILSPIEYMVCILCCFFKVFYLIIFIFILFFLLIYKTRPTY